MAGLYIIHRVRMSMVIFYLISAAESAIRGNPALCYPGPASCDLQCLVQNSNLYHLAGSR